MNKPISKYILWVLCSILVLSCSQMTSITSQENMETKPIEMVETIAKVGPNWLAYADPKADANLAIQNNQLHLLTFSGNDDSFPGIGDQQTEYLKQKCGRYFLPNNSDTSITKIALDHGNKLYQYAATYNVLVANACNKIID